jgi:hypothetical protein
MELDSGDDQCPIHQEVMNPTPLLTSTHDNVHNRPARASLSGLGLECLVGGGVQIHSGLIMDGSAERLEAYRSDFGRNSHLPASIPS